MIVEIFIGILLAAAFVVCAKKLGREMHIYALGLVVAAVIYLGFAVVGGAGARWTMIELLGIVPFTGFAVLGLRRTPWWLAAGWGIHPAWDAGLHLVRGTPAFVPAWYPTVCLGFDLFVMAILLWHAASVRTTTSRRGPPLPA